MTTLGLLERLVYDNPEPLVALAVLPGGRLALGLGLGGREDDHWAAGVDIRTRGRRLDEQMALLRRLWSGEPYADGVGPIGPAAGGGRHAGVGSRGRPELGVQLP